MAVVLGDHLLLAPASITARAVATMLGLVLVRLAHEAARSRALWTLALVVGHADKWLHRPTSAGCCSPAPNPSVVVIRRGDDRSCRSH
jgi:hypothetical protein